MICYANLARAHHQELAACELLSVFIKHHIDVDLQGLNGLGCQC